VIAFPERRRGVTIAALGLAFALAFGASLVWLAKPGGRLVFGDALHHYVQLRSLVFDRDVKFTNEYLRMYGLTPETVDSETRWVVDTNATGHIRNLMPVGPALAWAPAFLLTTGAVWTADRLGASYPLDGYGRVFQASAAFSGIAAAALGAWFAFLGASALFSVRSAIWATLLMWLSTSAVYYSVVSPTYSHAVSMCGVGAFWCVWIRTQDRQTLGRYALVGALAGVAALMRWQDVVLLVVPAIDAGWRHPVRGAAARIVVAAAAALAAFAPQMIVWERLYGHAFTIPQGAAFMRWAQPALWSVLFSDNHGLITWTPAIAVGIAGLVLLWRRTRIVAVCAAAFLLVSWYVNASVADWWAGEAFGARRFVACFPVFVLGAAAVFDRWHARPGRMAGLTFAFTALTFLLLLQYQTFMHGARALAPYPSGFYGLWLARFRVPIDLARRWLTGA
jgi:hypothetical protein